MQPMGIYANSNRLSICAAGSMEPEYSTTYDSIRPESESFQPNENKPSLFNSVAVGRHSVYLF